MGKKCLARVIFPRSPDERMKSRPLALSSVTGGYPVDSFQFSKTPLARSPTLGFVLLSGSWAGSRES